MPVFPGNIKKSEVARKLSSPPSKILVADTDEIVLALITHILHRQGYSVDVAVTLEQAQQCLSLNSYAAIVIDSTLTSAVNGHMSQTILLSRKAESDLPVNAVIQKPVEFGLLVDTVRKMTG